MQIPISLFWTKGVLRIIHLLFWKISKNIEMREENHLLKKKKRQEKTERSGKNSFHPSE